MVSKVRLLRDQEVYLRDRSSIVLKAGTVGTVLDQNLDLESLNVGFEVKIGFYTLFRTTLYLPKDILEEI